jgi:hypothetical protein
MGSESTLSKLLWFLGIMLTAAVPAYVAYDLYGRGPSPEKRVELVQIGPINPLLDLSALGEKASVSLRVADKTLDHLVLMQAFFKNIGDVPILPEDYHEKLRVAVKEPWEIVAVENYNLYEQTVRLRWTRTSDTSFEAEPALLNPGDNVGVHVYLTNTKPNTALSSNLAGEPQLEWSTRITNLQAFEIADILERMSS